MLGDVLIEYDFFQHVVIFSGCDFFKNSANIDSQNPPKSKLLKYK